MAALSFRERPLHSTAWSSSSSSSMQQQQQQQQQSFVRKQHSIVSEGDDHPGATRQISVRNRSNLTRGFSVGRSSENLRQNFNPQKALLRSNSTLLQRQATIDRDNNKFKASYANTRNKEATIINYAKNTRNLFGNNNNNNNNNNSNNHGTTTATVIKNNTNNNNNNNNNIRYKNNLNNRNLKAWSSTTSILKSVDEEISPQQKKRLLLNGSIDASEDLKHKDNKKTASNVHGIRTQPTNLLKGESSSSSLLSSSATKINLNIVLPQTIKHPIDNEANLSDIESSSEGVVDQNINNTIGRNLRSSINIAQPTKANEKSRGSSTTTLAAAATTTTTTALSPNPLFSSIQTSAAAAAVYRRAQFRTSRNERTTTATTTLATPTSHHTSIFTSFSTSSASLNYYSAATTPTTLSATNNINNNNNNNINNTANTLTSNIKTTNNNHNNNNNSNNTNTNNTNIIQQTTTTTIQRQIVTDSNANANGNGNAFINTNANLNYNSSLNANTNTNINLNTNSSFTNTNTFSASPSLTIQRRSPLVRAMSAPVRSFDENSKSVIASSKRKPRRRKIIARNLSCDKTQANFVEVATDVITLVSLMSSEGSDSEREDTSSNTTTSNPTTASDRGNLEGSSPTRRAPLLRKTGKSVSFQENYPPNFQLASKEYSHMIRRSSIAPLAARLRSNRPPTAPPVSIFLNMANNLSDNKDKSQLDLMTNSAGDSEKRTPMSEKEQNKENAAITASEQQSTEYVFPEYVRSIKEKECWKLYQKMCAKGVNVTYDTVLRGMLTPTEFRQLQKQRDAEEAKARELAEAESEGENKPPTAIERLSEALLKSNQK